MGPWRHGDGVDFEMGDFGVVMRDGASGGLVVMNSDRTIDLPGELSDQAKIRIWKSSREETLERPEVLVHDYADDVLRTR